MAYERVKTPTVSGGEVDKWMDEVYERPRTYTHVTNEDGSETYTKAGGELIQRGTNQSAKNFNQVEEGVQAAYDMGDAVYSFLMMMCGHSGIPLDEMEEIVTGKLAIYLRDAQHSIDQARIRDLEERLIVCETKLAAMT